MRALLRSPQAPEVLCSPGNAGIARDAAPFEGADDPAAIAAAGIDLVVVGPEAPLVAGFVDACQAAGVAAFGPVAGAAQLEGSKAYAKEVMAAAGVPTAGYTVVGDVEAGLAAIDELPGRAQGRRAGRRQGRRDRRPTRPRRARRSRTCSSAHRFGDAPVVVEEFLEGVELSVLALCDGESRAPARPGARLQAHRRGRHRPEHGRHGRVLAGRRRRRRR